jgi:hypothetical protein
MRCQIAFAVLLWGSGISTAAAQQMTAIPGRLELGAGVLWTGAQSLGSRDANLTTGTGSTLRLFTSASDLMAAAAFEARVAVKLTRMLDAEALASYGTPQLRTVVSHDTENSTDAVATETVKQYMVGGGVVWYLAPRRATAHVRPFVTAGASYLRQLHEAATVVTTGQTYYIGGGAKVLFASRPRKSLKTVGVRLDARAVVRTKGITFDGRRSLLPALGASLFVRF